MKTQFGELMSQSREGHNTRFFHSVSCKQSKQLAPYYSTSYTYTTVTQMQDFTYEITEVL